MGNYEELKQAVSNVIKTNGNQDITGQIMQNALLTIISTIGDNATFAGIATPNTNPGTPDQNVFWIATKNGEYVNFDAQVIYNEPSLFVNENGSWVKKVWEYPIIWLTIYREAKIFLQIVGLSMRL